MPFGRRKTMSTSMIRLTFFVVLQLLQVLSSSSAAQIPPSHVSLGEEPLDSPGWYDHELTVQCTEDEMLISVSPRSSGVSFLDNSLYSRDTGFSGTIYPRGLGKATGCLTRYRKAQGPIMYRLPLRACNTMPYTLDDGTVEYRNVLMVQPHPRLVTGRGKAHELSCKPPAPAPSIQTGSRVPHAARLTDIKPGDKFDVSMMSSEKLPSCSMKIYKGDPIKKQIATNVKIGDPLTLTISLDKELGKYGMEVTDCTVKDGLGWTQQDLINDDGCPLDNEIMGMFQYAKNGTMASVTFQAHKFPYTSSVYYQCSIKLCSEHNRDECQLGCTNEKSRKKRQIDEGTPATIQTYSGLTVNEATDLPSDNDFVTQEKNPEDAICISQRNFAIAICVAGLILMLAAVTAILVILARRRGPKSISNTGSSIYSGPYTNTGYSHTS